MIPIVKDPMQAAQMLREGRIVDYEPGDGTRYDLRLMQVASFEYVLLMLNFGCFVKQPRDDDPIGANRWTTSSAYPSGVWMGMRPLLAALGWAKGPTSILQTDQSEESLLRTRQYGDNERVSPEQQAKDAAFGRKVRRLYEASQ